MYYLIYAWNCQENAETTLGRASSNDIIVNGLGVADHHAKIIYDADNFAATVVPHTHAVLVYLLVLMWLYQF